VPRTQKGKKPAIGYCAECGYPLAPDGDGTCLMCPRLQQMRIGFTVPRPSELGAHRLPVLGTNETAALDDWPPTVAEYRAILAERRVSTSADPSRGRVIETSELRQIRVRPVSLSEADLDAPAPPVPSRVGLAASSPARGVGAKRSKGKRGNRRAARPRAPLPSVDENKPGLALKPSAGQQSADSPVTDDVAAAPDDPEAQGASAVTAESVSTPRHTPRPRMDLAPMRSESRWRSEARGPWLVTVAVVAGSALIGLMVALFLSSP
jgi:hypothetical protein